MSIVNFVGVFPMQSPSGCEDINDHYHLLPRMIHTSFKLHLPITNRVKRIVGLNTLNQNGTYCYFKYWNVNV